MPTISGADSTRVIGHSPWAPLSCHVNHSLSNPLVFIWSIETLKLPGFPQAVYRKNHSTSFVSELDYNFTRAEDGEKLICSVSGDRPSPWSYKTDTTINFYCMCLLTQGCIHLLFLHAFVLFERIIHYQMSYRKFLFISETNYKYWQQGNHFFANVIVDSQRNMFSFYINNTCQLIQMISYDSLWIVNVFWHGIQFDLLYFINKSNYFHISIQIRTQRG